MYSIAVVDDNINDLDKARSLLEKNFETKRTCFYSNPQDALKDADYPSFDLVILDINMPQLNGFEFLNETQNFNVEVVFCTSEEGYALEAYKQYALGYLLKPYSEADFITVISKAFKRMSPNTNKNRFTSEFISVATKSCIYVLPVQDIIRIQSINNYVKFFVNDGNVHLSSRIMKYYLKSLDKHRFIRVHKSHLINVDFILKYYSDGTLVLKNGDRIPVARRRRDELLDYLKGDVLG